jgi:hypothetical protein
MSQLISSHHKQPIVQLVGLRLFEFTSSCESAGWNKFHQINPRAPPPSHSSLTFPNLSAHCILTLAAPSCRRGIEVTCRRRSQISPKHHPTFPKAAWKTRPFHWLRHLGRHDDGSCRMINHEQHSHDGRPRQDHSLLRFCVREY